MLIVYAVDVHFEYSIQRNFCILNLKGFFICLPLTTKIGEKLLYMWLEMMQTCSINANFAAISSKLVK